jgi:hypothetical protein
VRTAISFQRILVFLIALFVITAEGELLANEFHVAPVGTPQGKGSIDAPWDLATALAPPAAVQPGDTIWLDAGTYRGGFVARLAGRPDAPIVVRGEPKARVTIDTKPRDERDNGLFSVLGSDTIYRDFELTCSDPVRETKIAGSWPADIRRGTVDVHGSRIALVNLVVHDLSSGFGFWSEGEGGEISGCLIYNNGWRGPDRGHGHAIYVQNAQGTKRLVDNIVFHQFAYGIHAYGSKKASLKGIEVEGNIAFENGCLARTGDHSPGIMIGGESPAERIVIRDNVVSGGSIRVGYPWGPTNEDVVCTGNYCDNGFVLRDFRKATVTKNTLVASSTVASLEGAGKLLLAGLRWNENEYYVTDGRWGDCSFIENSKSRGLTFDEWRRETGFDAHSTFTKGSPTKVKVIVRPNACERGRAHVAVLNPAGLPEVDVDLSAVLEFGQRFEIVSAKDYFGPTVVSGTYEGKTVRLPMQPIRPAAPVGLANAELPVTEPQFAAFVVQLR